MQPQGLAGQLAGAQGAGVGEGAVGLALDIAFFLPFRELSNCRDLSGVLYPLNYLEAKIIS